MPIELSSLDSLDSNLVATLRDRMGQLVQESNPSLDLRRGVLRDLLLHLHAVLSAKHSTELSRYIAARSLRQVLEDPTLADADIVDDILSNWRITRRQGTAASGEVAIVLNSPTSVTIGAGAVFSAAGKTFKADTVFIAKAEAGLINSSIDRLLSRTPDGKWVFTITVTASETGAASAIKKDTQVIPANLPTGYVTSYAVSDFTGGVDVESNLSLLQRLQEGMAAKAPSNRVTMAATLRDVPRFAGIIAQSIVGFGDPEQRRDKHTIFPAAFGGRADWYVRTQARAELTTLRLTATLVQTRQDGSGVWQFAIGRDDAPGFYMVDSVRAPGAVNVLGSYDLLSVTRGVNVTGSGFIPDIVGVTEAAFSRYQTAVVQFVDDDKNHDTLSAGATAEYDVAVRVLPLIAGIQDHVNSYDVRPYGSDILIKAPVPCFVTVSMTIDKKRTQTDPDVAAIQTAVANKINAIGFVGRVYASQIQDVVHNFLAAEMSVSRIDLLGTIVKPDGTTLTRHSTNTLSVPAGLEDQMISEKTVQFFTDPDDVAVDINTSVPVSL